MEFGWVLTASALVRANRWDIMAFCPRSHEEKWAKIRVGCFLSR